MNNYLFQRMHVSFLILLLLLSVWVVNLSGCSNRPLPIETQTPSEHTPEDGEFLVSRKIGLSEAFEVPLNKDIGQHNYMNVRYHSVTGIKGTLFYTDPRKSNAVYSEDFYLDSGVNKSFNLIIGQEEKEQQASLNSRFITHVRFANLENKIGELKVETLDFSTKSLDSEQLFMDNGNLKIGVNLSWGGALFYLAYKQEKVFQVDHEGATKIGVDYDQLKNAVVSHTGDINLLNHHDVGRLVQQSYYGTSLPPYVTGTYLGMPDMPYNPVQGGDQQENESKIVDFYTSGDTIYIKCQPRDWAPATLSPAYMENTYVLHDHYLEINNKFIDYSRYIPEVRDQEMPAVYTVRNLDNWVLYDGDKPFTGDKLTTARTKGNDAAYRVVNHRIAENWAALVNDQHFGVGVYVPDLHEGILTTFGYSETITDPDSRYYNQPLSTMNPTSYMTLTGKLAFQSLKPLCYTAYLAAGNVDSMRSTFYKLKQQGANNKSFLNYGE